MVLEVFSGHVFVEESGDVTHVAAQERARLYIVEQIVDVSVRQVVDEMLPMILS